MDRALTLFESEERFRGCFEAAAIGFALVDTDGRLRAANESLRAMLGYTEAELVGMTFIEFTHPDDRVAAEELRLRVLEGGSKKNHLEKRYLHKDGHIVWVLVAVSLVRSPNGDAAYFVAQMTDITSRKVAEQALARRAAELERSNTELREFASLASHDLQEPLRAISSYSQLLAEQHRQNLDDTGKRWLAYIVDGVGRMTRLIDDMLEVASVRTAAVDVSETDVAQLLADEWLALRDQYGSLGAKLTVATLPTIMADESQVQVLLRNLLVNALKYRKAAVPLEIHVSARLIGSELGDEPMWHFAVEDNGIGLDMIHAHQIFEIFHRLHPDNEYGGTGVGLAICKRIVERHGGSIWVESVPNEGATFWFTLGSEARP